MSAFYALLPDPQHIVSLAEMLAPFVGAGLGYGLCFWGIGYCVYLFIDICREEVTL